MEKDGSVPIGRLLWIDECRMLVMMDGKRPVENRPENGDLKYTTREAENVVRVALGMVDGGPCPHYDCEDRNSFGYCKTTACINPKYSNIGTAKYEQGVQKRIATNADRIRAMTDADLATFISKVKIDGLLRLYELPTTAIDWREWLEQEAQDAVD